MVTFLLEIMLFLFALLIHLPGMMGGSMEMSMPDFMKGLAMSVASFYMSSTFSE